MAVIPSLRGTGEASDAECKHSGRVRPYQFRRDVFEPMCLVCAVLYRPVLRRAVCVALVVGTILNQGDVLLAGALAPLVAAKILLTYAVPYGASNFSALSANLVTEITSS